MNKDEQKISFSDVLTIMTPASSSKPIWEFPPFKKGFLIKMTFL
jgi:hypothetical protein